MTSHDPFGRLQIIHAMRSSNTLRTLRKYQKIVKYSIVHWPSLAAIALITIALSVLVAFQPIPLKIAVDYGINGLQPPSELIAWMDRLNIRPNPSNLILSAGLAAILIQALSALLDGLRTWLKTLIGLRMTYTLAGDLFQHILRLSQVFHSRRSVGDSITRITNDSWCVQTVIESILVSPAQHIATLITVGLVAWQLDKQLTIIIICISPFLTITSKLYGKKLKLRERKKIVAKASITGLLHNILGAMPMVQVFSAEERNISIFKELANKAVKANEQGALARGSFDLLNGILITLGSCLILLLGGRRVLSGELAIGSLLVFVAYVKTLESASRGLLKTYADLRTTEAKIDRVLELFDSKETILEAPIPRQLPRLHANSRGHLVFNNVTFGYEANRPVINSFFLDIQPGETLALIGKTGSGKSTIASLALRLLDPWGGEVLLDGINLRQMQLANLRKETTIVLQDPFLLPLSIAENIAYGKITSDKQNIIVAAKAANAHEFISRLPEGYDTVIGEQGVTLSGGQRQRLAIARALLNDSRLLVLDEPTSALDTKTERLVMEALYHLMKGRTTIVIAHRLSTVRRADRIAVLEKGRIVEIGSYLELMKLDGRFARLERLQTTKSTHLQIIP